MIFDKTSVCMENVNYKIGVWDGILLTTFDNPIQPKLCKLVAQNYHNNCSLRIHIF